MNNVIDIVSARENAKEIIGFNDGRPVPINDTLTADIYRKLFLGFCAALVVGSIVFKEFLFADESVYIWGCFLVALLAYFKLGKKERRECFSELLFFDDYMIFYVPKHHIKHGNERMEIQRMYYKDVKESEFRTNTRKMCIFGMVDEVHYKYDKNGKLCEKPSYQRRYDGMIFFYTMFAEEHDFKELIERNSTLTIKYSNS